MIVAVHVRHKDGSTNPLPGSWSVERLAFVLRDSYTVQPGDVLVYEYDLSIGSSRDVSGVSISSVYAGGLTA